MPQIHTLSPGSSSRFERNSASSPVSALLPSGVPCEGLCRLLPASSCRGGLRVVRLMTNKWHRAAISHSPAPEGKHRRHPAYGRRAARRRPVWRWWASGPGGCSPLRCTTFPLGITPGQFMIIGTCMPPSKALNLFPRKGALLPAVAGLPFNPARASRVAPLSALTSTRVFCSSRAPLARCAPAQHLPHAIGIQRTGRSWPHRCGVRAPGSGIAACISAAHAWDSAAH